ncbi:trans-sulfuration enzyme family protein [Sinomonas atrocyanea]|uniref:trans-sulfuration enzyme family protein n=1 Tax=Sinomonas atrocyanea TaxID=37927 RepID=UPI003D9935F5
MTADPAYPHLDDAALADLSPETLAVAAGRPERGPDSPVNPSIVLSSTFVGLGGIDQSARGYARFSNPTWEPFEDAVGKLEAAPLPALLFSSGMGAVAAAMSLVPVGGVLVAPRHSYSGTLGLAQLKAERGELDLLEVDIEDTAATVAALDGADVLWVESPTNPMMEVADLPALVAAAKARGVLVVVDNTFSTPLGQKPLAVGADVVVHSATKYLAGHSDVLLGLAVTANETLRARLHQHRTLHGAIAGPVEAWLGLRGLRTLALRVERSQATAGELARRLAAHPAVTRVRYPGLPTDPGHDRAAAQFEGFGSIVSIELDTAQAADAFVGRLALWLPATSLGGVESTIERRRRHAAEPLSVPEGLVRLSVGIEHADDLWADLKQSLDAGL